MNHYVEECREIGLSLLDATQAQIEHGLELHRDSVVIDAYGFAPRAAIDSAVLAGAIEAGASEIELQDLQEDMTMTRSATDPREREEFQAAWDLAGVTCIFQNAGEEGQAPLRVMKRLARFTYTTDMMPDFMPKAAVPEDIEAAHREGRHCLYFSGNGVPLTQDWINVQEELRYIRLFFQLGIRMMHITYNRRNMLGDGCAEPGNAGLSDFGRAVVAELNRQHVIPDVAHSGWQTSLETAQVSERPMVASHSGCAAVNLHHRCKPDEVIRAIVDTGGYIGICAIPAFLGRSGDINALLDHIDYVVKNFGADHVAIGMDTAYTSSAMAAEYAKLPSRRAFRKRWNNFWQPNDPVHAPEWHQDHMQKSLAWTNWPLFTVGLVKRGYSDDDIRKILGGNVLRVTKANLK